MNAPSIRLTFFPPRFVQDCLESGCDVGDYSIRSRTLEANSSQLAELRSRAQHYAHGGLDTAPRGVIASAKATLAALEELERSLRQQIEMAEANLSNCKDQLAILTGELA